MSKEKKDGPWFPLYPSRPETENAIAQRVWDDLADGVAGEHGFNVEEDAATHYRFHDGGDFVEFQLNDGGTMSCSIEHDGDLRGEDWHYTTTIISVFAFDAEGNIYR